MSQTESRLFYASVCCSVVSKAAPENILQQLGKKSIRYTLSQYDMSCELPQILLVKCRYPDGRSCLIMSFGASDNYERFLLSQDLKEVTIDTTTQVNVHFGSWKIANSVSLCYLAKYLIDPESKTQILLCGYATGGIIASLVAYTLLTRYTEQCERIHCVTFSCPLFGGAQLRNIAEKYQEHFTHVYLEDDGLSRVLSIAMELENVKLHGELVTTIAQKVNQLTTLVDDEIFLGSIKNIVKHYDTQQWEYRFSGSKYIQLNSESSNLKLTEYNGFLHQAPNRLHTTTHQMTVFVKILSEISKAVGNISDTSKVILKHLLRPRIEKVIISMDTPYNLSIQVLGRSLWFPLAIKFDKKLFGFDIKDDQITHSVQEMKNGTCLFGHFHSTLILSPSPIDNGAGGIEIFTLCGRFICDTAPKIICPILSPQTDMSYRIAGEPSFRLIEIVVTSCLCRIFTFHRALVREQVPFIDDLLDNIEQQCILLDDVWRIVDIKTIVKTKELNPELSDSISRIIQDSFDIAIDTKDPVAHSIAEYAGNLTSESMVLYKLAKSNIPSATRKYLSLPIRSTQWCFKRIFDDAHNSYRRMEEWAKTQSGKADGQKKLQKLAEFEELLFRRCVSCFEVIKSLMNFPETREGRWCDVAMNATSSFFVKMLNVLSQRNIVEHWKRMFESKFYWSYSEALATWPCKLQSVTKALMVEAPFDTCFFLEEKLHSIREELSQDVQEAGNAISKVEFDFGHLSSFLLDTSDTVYWKERLDAFAHLGASIYSLRSILVQKHCTLAVVGTGNSGKSVFSKLAFGVDTGGGRFVRNRTRQMSYSSVPFGQTGITIGLLDLPGSDEVFEFNEYKQLTMKCIDLASVVLICFRFANFRTSGVELAAETFGVLQKFHIPFLVCLSFVDYDKPNLIKNRENLQTEFELTVKEFNQLICQTGECAPLTAHKQGPIQSNSVVIVNFKDPQPSPFPDYAFSVEDIRNWVTDQFLTVKKHIYASKKFKSSDLSEFRLIGGGANGRVYEVKLKEKKIVAAKELYFLSNDPSNIAVLGGPFSSEVIAVIKELLLKECLINSCLYHPNIVKFEGIAYDQENQIQYLLLERMHWSLNDRLYTPTQPPLTLGEIINILTGICRALDYLHSIKPPILHLDLKPANILLDVKGNPKLSDWGEAHQIRASPLKNNPNVTLTPFGIGTPLYQAPEMRVQDAEKSSKVDMYAVGWIVVEMANVRQPNFDPNERLEDIDSIENDFLKNLAINLTCNDPNQRWSAKKVIDYLQNRI